MKYAEIFDPEAGPTSFPTHAAILALIDRYTVFISSSMDVNEITGITSYLAGWGPEDSPFDTGSAHYYGVTLALIDLEESAHFIEFNFDDWGYRVTEEGRTWLTSPYFTHEYWRDLLTVSEWYTDMMKGPKLRLGKHEI